MLTAADLMTPAPVTVRHDDSMAVAVSIMRMGVKPIRHLPVLENGKLVGMVSDRDAARTRGWEHVKVQDAMSKGLYIVRPRTPLRRAIDRMIKHNIGALPVVDCDGTVVGILSLVDVAQCMANLVLRIDALQAGRRRGLTPTDANRLMHISSMLWASLPDRVPLARRSGRRSFAARSQA
ncbi:MAG: CBS domain-containing protein [Deltaproteobacteria bacterium]|nr:CBS domain-containing protein [Deltaproteobacteria bacterium]